MDIFDFIEKRTINLENVFSTAPSTDKGDLDTNFRKFGHLMEKKVSLWWDIAAHEQYIKDKIVPRRLRWDVPICDGLTDQDATNEWYKFFNDKGLDLVHFALKRKQRKLNMINQQIAECKTILDPFKETAPFSSLTQQLNKVLEQKDVELKQRKKRKYLRDTNDYQLEQVFNWQINAKQGKTGSIASSPDREVRIVSPRRNTYYRTPERRSRTPETPRYNQQKQWEQSNTHDNGSRTPKPWWRNKTKNKSPRRPYWKNNANKRPNKPHYPPYNQSRSHQSGNESQYDQVENGRYPRYGEQGYYQHSTRTEPRENQYNSRNDPRNSYQQPHRDQPRDYRYDQDRRDHRDYQQSNGESRDHQSNGNRNGTREYDQYRYPDRRSPLPTTNRYEPLRNYIEEEQSRSFLDFRRNEDPPPLQEYTNRERSPNTIKGDAEQDGKPKRKREY